MSNDALLSHSTSRYDVALEEALSEYESALGRATKALKPVHPVRDFEKLCVVFCMWKRLLRSDERAICHLSVLEARQLFVEFTVEYNSVRLPIEFYRAFPEAEEVGRLPEGSALRNVLEATHARDLFSRDDVAL